MKAGIYLVTILLMAMVFSAYAQTGAKSPDNAGHINISGSIISQADAKPLASASVFLSNTTIGSKSEDDGTFILHNVKPGQYELIISVVGFETYRQKITVNNARLTLPVIIMVPKTNMLKEVTIRVDPNHQRNLDWFYERFKTEFLGTTELAKDCKILNPDVLDIDYDEPNNTITATSSDYLEIENDALGYRIKYLLTYFKYRDISKNAKEIYYEGPALFTEMKGTPQQERRWQKMREEVYEGSARHFLHSVLESHAAENGFRVLRYEIYRNPERPPDTLMEAKIKLFKRLKSSGEKRYKDSLSFWTKKFEMPDTIRKVVNFPINRDNVIEPAGQKGLFALNCNNDWLYITYNKNHNYPSNPALYSLDKPDNTENTLMRFNSQDAFFDVNGVITNPATISFRGVWGRGRVAWLLPSDYELAEKPIVYSDTVLSKMAGRMDSYTESRNVEKVYLHLDKPNYGYGDTIWYKAYTIAGQHHQLSGISGVLYVELLSPKDSLITRQAVLLNSGIGWSDIPLSHSLKQGTYRLRAYTRWMQNEGPDYFYDQRVRIGGVAVAMVNKNSAEHPDVQFFPEGGELVNGLRSRVAVKAVGANGLGENVKGTIEDNTGNVVADFATQHLGMGVFALTPVAGKTYKASINIPGEASYTVDLPKAKQTGYTLALNSNAPDSIYIKITTNELTLSQDKEKTFYVIAQSNGKVYYTSQGKLENMVYMARVEKSRFPTGIAQFTVFSQTGEPIAERIAFIGNNDQLKLNITTDNKTYTTRQKVKLELTGNDSLTLAQGSFSVAVINESAVQPEENAESTIENNLLLTSELNGYIERPGYYFINKSEQAKADLDMLMLTQGYRRYEWKQVLGKAAQLTAYKPEKALELNGILTAPDGKPIPNGSVTLASTQQNLFRDTTTDANGRFTFGDLYITDTAIMVLRARKANNGSNVKIKALVPDYPPIIPAKKINYSVVSTDTTKQYTNYQNQQKEELLKNGKTLNTVNINGIKRPKQPDLSTSSNLGGGGHADQVIMGDKLGDCANLSDCLTGKVMGVSVNSKGAINNRNGADMSIILDGITLDHRHLNDVNPNDIYSIEVLRSVTARSIYGSSVEGGGALIITMKQGGETIATNKTQQTTAQLQYSQYETAQKNDSLKKGKTLNTVNIKGIKRPQQPELTNSANLNGPGHANQVIMYDQLADCISLEQCLNGKIGGVMFQYGKFYRVRNMARSTVGSKMPGVNNDDPMAIIVDGMIFDQKHYNVLAELNTTDVYSIEVLTSGSYLTIYGSSASGGALVITTKRGGEKGTAYFTQAQPSGIITFPFAGLYKAKAFYAPKYEPANDKQLPDNRTTVYWNPNIITDKDGKAAIEYFNNDTKGTYRVVVEGIDENGKLGRAVYRYTVE